MNSRDGEQNPVSSSSVNYAMSTQASIVVSISQHKNRHMFKYPPWGGHPRGCQSPLSGKAREALAFGCSSSTHTRSVEISKVQINLARFCQPNYFQVKYRSISKTDKHSVSKSWGLVASYAFHKLARRALLRMVTRPSCPNEIRRKQVNISTENEQQSPLLILHSNESEKVGRFVRK